MRRNTQAFSAFSGVNQHTFLYFDFFGDSLLRFCSAHRSAAPTERVPYPHVETGSSAATSPLVGEGNRTELLTQKRDLLSCSFHSSSSFPTPYKPLASGALLSGRRCFVQDGTPAFDLVSQDRLKRNYNKNNKKASPSLGLLFVSFCC